jgi:hypothetical protein
MIMAYILKLQLEQNLTFVPARWQCNRGSSRHDTTVAAERCKGISSGTLLAVVVEETLLGRPQRQPSLESSLYRGLFP